MPRSTCLWKLLTSVIDAEGKIVREAKVLSEPDALISWFAGHQVAMERIGLEAGPLSQWLYASM